jgi:hypothetical protein
VTARSSADENGYCLPERFKIAASQRRNDHAPLNVELHELLDMR